MSEPFIGQIIQVGFNFAPRNWALCDGGLLPVSQYTALFSLLGCTFGGDCRTTFALPDLRGRVAKHVGNGTGLASVAWGQKGGIENKTLNVTEIPAHSHTGHIRSVNKSADTSDAAGNSLANAAEDIYVNAAADTDMHAGTVQTNNTGGGKAFDIRNPYLGIYHCIALTGLYPSRN